MGDIWKDLFRKNLTTKFISLCLAVTVLFMMDKTYELTERVTMQISIPLPKRLSGDFVIVEGRSQTLTLELKGEKEKVLNSKKLLQNQSEDRLGSYLDMGRLDQLFFPKEPKDQQDVVIEMNRDLIGLLFLNADIEMPETVWKLKLNKIGRCNIEFRQPNPAKIRVRNLSEDEVPGKLQIYPPRVEAVGPIAVINYLEANPVNLEELLPEFDGQNKELRHVITLPVNYTIEGRNYSVSLNFPQVSLQVLYEPAQGMARLEVPLPLNEDGSVNMEAIAAKLDIRLRVEKVDMKMPGFAIAPQQDFHGAACLVYEGPSAIIAKARKKISEKDFSFFLDANLGLLVIAEESHPFLLQADFRLGPDAQKLVLSGKPEDPRVEIKLVKTEGAK